MTGVDAGATFATALVALAANAPTSTRLSSAKRLIDNDMNVYTSLQRATPLGGLLEITVVRKVIA